MDHRDQFDLVPPREAARALGVSECTLARWRGQALGPAYVWVGGRVRYSMPLLHAYVEQQTRHAGQEVA